MSALGNWSHKSSSLSEVVLGGGRVGGGVLENMEGSVEWCVCVCVGQEGGTLIHTLHHTH